MESRQLSDGTTIPVLALGVWQVRNGRECVNAVRWALDLGYRHIDTAQLYGNEESVGRAVQESGVPREDLLHHHQIRSVAPRSCGRSRGQLAATRP